MAGNGCQHWFRWTGKCFETATSHMQTVVGNEMTNYYKILNIPNDSGKKRAYTAFKKRFLSKVNKEVKIDLLTGFLIIVNDRQKFLNILLAQHDKGKKLTPKYLAVISSERKRAELAIRDDSTETEISRALKTYPFRESITGLL